MNTVSIQTSLPQTLSPFIKSFWFLETSDFSRSAYEEEIIPDGHHEIIFHLGSFQAKRKTEDGNWLREPNAFLASQNLKSYRLRLQPGTRIYGIRFYPHTLFNFLGVPVADLTDRILPLSDLFETSGFWNCIGDDAQTTFLNFDRLLSEKISHPRFEPDDCSHVGKSVTEILKRGGNVSIKHLAKKTGISLKHLDESFKKQVCITPKTLCRIIKLNRFISYKTNNPEKTLTECAYEIDYYDQSHLIKSFRKLTNRSPKIFFNDSNRINEIFTNL